MHPSDTIYLDYLESEDTIYNNLQENNPLAMNVPNFPVSKNIAKRVEDASRRLADITEYSLSKKKERSLVHTGHKNTNIGSRGKNSSAAGINKANDSSSHLKTHKKICAAH